LIQLGKRATSAVINDVVPIGPLIHGSFKEIGKVKSRRWHICLLSHHSEYDPTPSVVVENRYEFGHRTTK
jgi:hypothetical protein